MEGIWEGVLLAEVPHLGKPGVLDVVVENMYTMLVEDVVRAQDCNHMEEGELVLMEQSRGREGAGEGTYDVVYWIK